MAEDFIGLYASLRASASFSIREHGDANALILARSWIHRLFFFFSMWADEGYEDKPKHFSQEELDRYVEPDELRIMAEGAKAATLARITQIRVVCPK